MTICIGYLRTSIFPPEIIIASDSRLKAGETFDYGRKIFPLRRGDAALCFAGDTFRFFPIFSQIIAFCDEHKKNYTRAFPLPELFNYISNLANDLVAKTTELPPGILYASGECSLWLCGWNWAQRKDNNNPLFLGQLNYDDNTGRFKRKIYYGFNHRGCFHSISVIGDCVSGFLQEYNAVAKKGSILDMEPLKIFQGIIDSRKFPSIGGTLQAIKIYKHYNILPISVSRNNKRFLYGRELFDWEEISYETTNLNL